MQILRVVVIACIGLFSMPTYAAERYCLLLASSTFLSSKVKVEVDYGETTEKLRSDNGKVAKFESVISALNYMSGEGWQFVDAYAITVGNQNVYHYLMRREE